MGKPPRGLEWERISKAGQPGCEWTRGRAVSGREPALLCAPGSVGQSWAGQCSCLVYAFGVRKEHLDQ